MDEGWRSAAQEYVQPWAEQLGFSGRSIAAIEPLVHDSALLEKLDGALETHIVHHLRSVLARDIVSFVGKAFDRRKDSISLKRRLENLRKWTYWSRLDTQWRANGGVHFFIDTSDGLSISEPVDPSAYVESLLDRLRCIEVSDRYSKVKSTRHLLVSHLGDPSCQGTQLNLPSYDDLFAVSNEVFDVSRDFVRFMTLADPTDYRELYRPAVEEFWARLAGVDPSEIQFVPTTPPGAQ